MTEKYNDSTRNRPWGERPLDAPIVKVDLKAFIQQIKMEEAWRKNDRNAITVFKTDSIRHVLVALHKGAVMTKDSSEGVMSIQLLEGKVGCMVGDYNEELCKGQILTIHERLPYHIHAIEEATFLLTISR